MTQQLFEYFNAIYTAVNLRFIILFHASHTPSLLQDIASVLYNGATWFAHFITSVKREGFTRGEEASWGQYSITERGNMSTKLTYL